MLINETIMLNVVSVWRHRKAVSTETVKWSELPHMIKMFFLESAETSQVDAHEQSKCSRGWGFPPRVSAEDHYLERTIHETLSRGSGFSPSSFDVFPWTRHLSAIVALLQLISYQRGWGLLFWAAVRFKLVCGAQLWSYLVEQISTVNNVFLHQDISYQFLSVSGQT